MKNIPLFIVIIALSGCAHMTTTDKVVVATSIIAMGILISQDSDSKAPIYNSCTKVQRLDLPVFYVCR